VWKSYVFASAQVATPALVNGYGIPKATRHSGFVIEESHSRLTGTGEVVKNIFRSITALTLIQAVLVVAMVPIHRGVRGEWL